MRPLRPLPEPLRGNEIGSFAHDTIVRRLPEIARRTAAENRLDEMWASRVEALAAEIEANSAVTVIDEPELNDAAAWTGYVDSQDGRSWLDVSWFFAETYFYRRVLAATGYSQPGDRCGVDPFGPQKETGLDGALELAARLGETLDAPAPLLAAALWSNRVDMSLWPAGESDSDARTRGILGRAASHLLADDSEQVLPLLDGGNIQIVLDNAGAELVADLALAASVLESGGRVTLHAKAHPTFVSDAMPVDIEITLDKLASESSPGRRIAAAVRNSGELEVTTHPFWVSPLPFWERPSGLDRALETADLIVIKGDANYRRLIGDSHWDPTTPFSEIVRPSAPLVALRTSKAETIAGLSAETVGRVTATDPEWQTNGQWGVIQYAPKIGSGVSDGE